MPVKGIVPCPSHHKEIMALPFLKAEEVAEQCPDCETNFR